MNIKSILFFAILGFGVLSCKKEANLEPKVEKQELATSPAKDVKIGVISVPDDKIGIGCQTTYFRKAKELNDLIFMQAGAPDEKGWINFLNIDGKQIEFYTTDASSEENGENMFTIKLENDDYQVIIDATIGEVSIDSDTAQAHGVIKVINKKTKATGSAEFEGGTGC
ncbi:hypothetical protein [Soonwooa sp.]|uniref:hypothetical protein n=1 Tax=Soonwooa sp. TaxID=1938592 RepID=UPI00260ACEC9|nr:hypothetical protein [Soonwooa sp.]